MESFESAVDRLLFDQAVTPSAIVAHAKDALARRGLRNPGGLVASEIERSTLGALQIISNAALAEFDRRIKGSGSSSAAQQEAVTSYLSRKFEPIVTFAANESRERRTSFASITRATAEQLILTAKNHMAATHV